MNMQALQKLCERFVRTIDSATALETNWDSNPPDLTDEDLDGQEVVLEIESPASRLDERQSVLVHLTARIYGDAIKGWEAAWSELFAGEGTFFQWLDLPELSIQRHYLVARALARSLNAQGQNSACQAVVELTSEQLHAALHRSLRWGLGLDEGASSQEVMRELRRQEVLHLLDTFVDRVQTGVSNLKAYAGNELDGRPEFVAKVFAVHQAAAIGLCWAWSVAFEQDIVVEAGTSTAAELFVAALVLKHGIEKHRVQPPLFSQEPLPLAEILRAALGVLWDSSADTVRWCLRERWRSHFFHDWLCQSWLKKETPLVVIAPPDPLYPGSIDPPKPSGPI